MSEELEYTDKYGRLTLAGVEKVMGKSVEELLKDPANRESLSQILSDSALKEVLKLPADDVSFNRQSAEELLKKYGRMPTPDELPSMDEIDKYFESARKYDAMAKQARFNAIKEEYKNIRDAEKFLKKRTEIIMGNTAYIDYEMIRKDQRDTDVHIAHVKERIEELYKKVNPELAALREEERAKVENGMDPKEAQKKRREAVKAYYNKKTQIEK